MTKPTMERRHFEAIAHALYNLPDTDGLVTMTHQALCEHVARHMAVYNPSFNRARFLEACGGGGMSAFQLDTSGYVEHPKGSNDVSAIYWTDLNPFTQGYIEALFADLNGRLFKTGGYDPTVDLARYSNLAPETLARIIEDCAKILALRTEGRSQDARDGQIFWRYRQAGLSNEFLSLTLTLSADGKVRFQ